MAEVGFRAIDCRELSPENRLVAGLMAMRFGAPRPVPDPGIDWATFLHRVRQHRVALWFGADELGRGIAPRPAVIDLLRLQAVERRRLDLVEAETIRLAAAFAEAGIDLLLLKGAALSAWLYDGQRLRAARDVDLLVRPGASRAASALLCRLGYDDAAATTIRHPNAMEMRHATTGLPVELHVRFDDAEDLFPLRQARPFDTALEVRLGETSLRTLAPELAIVYAAYHGTKHLWRRLFWLGDIAQAMGSPQLDWPAVFALARRIGVDRHLALALALAHDLLGSGIPPAAAPMLDAMAAGTRRAAGVMRPALVATDFVDEPVLRRRMGRMAYAAWGLGLLRHPAARLAQFRLWCSL